MALAGLILLASLSLPPQWDPDVAAVQAELRRCGVEPAPITYDDTIQGYTTIIPGPGPSDHVVDCLGSSTEFDLVDLQFADVERYTRFGQAVAARPDVIARMEAIRTHQAQYLADRGLLADLPQFHNGDDIAKFGVAIEQHCGAEPGSMLIAMDGRLSVQTTNGPPDYEQLGCVLYALNVAGVALAIGVAIIGEATE